jgi:flagella basal body P-ring formation protein FlgA
MMRLLAVIVGLTLAGPAMADSLVVTRTIRAQTVIQPEDITLVEADIPGALTTTEDAVGQEAKVTLYAGRPVLGGDVAPPALVKRNQMVTLVFQSEGLTIHTDGRALERGAVGDLIHVMNLSSHLTITGFVSPDGSVSVGPSSKG